MCLRILKFILITFLQYAGRSKVRFIILTLEYKKFALVKE